MLIEAMVEATPLGGSRTFKPEEIVEQSEQPRFYSVDHSYECRPDLFKWLGRRPLGPPIARRIGLPADDLSMWAPFELRFDGELSIISDLFRAGQTLFVSELVKDIIISIDHEAVQAVPVDVKAEGGFKRFYATLPKRSIVPFDLRANELIVRREKIAEDIYIPHVTTSRRYIFNRDIDKSVQVFASLTGADIFWSDQIVMACKERGARGILAQATYLPKFVTVEM
jgi:hypothetical protein